MRDLLVGLIDFPNRWLAVAMLACHGSWTTAAADQQDERPIRWVSMTAENFAGAEWRGRASLRIIDPAANDNDPAMVWKGSGGVRLPGFWAPGGIDPATTETLVMEIDLAGQQNAVLEVVLAEPDYRASFRRKVELVPGHRLTLEIPLRWMRWGDGRVPRWSEIRSLALGFEGEGLVIRRIGLQHSPHGPGAWPDADEMIRLAFGDRTVIRQQLDGLRLWSAADQVDAVKLVQHLAQVRQVVIEEWGLPKESQDGRPPTLLVFEGRPCYREFVPRFAAALGADALRPDSGGFHLQGWALSYYDPRHGSLRPVFTHEFAHSVVAHHGLIDGSRSDWFHEGIAVRLQTRFHPQDDLGDIIGRGLRRSALPLRRLCDGDHLELRHYWQAMTVVDWLVDSGQVEIDSRRRLVAAMQRAGGTALGPHLKPVLGTDWAALEADWRAWTESKWVR